MIYINDALPQEYTKEEYVSLPVRIDNNNHRNNSFSIFMDVWGEANHAIEMEGRERDDISRQLKTLHDICNIMYSNSDIDKEIKEELMESEWELADYLLGKNIYGYDHEGVMSWFDQWCYSIDYSFLD